MAIDTLLLSRIQFAFTISFHILFPAFSIGLSAFLAVMEGIWLKTRNPEYLSICKFWTKIFALTFGMGIVSGIVMEFQLGTNWSGFTRAVGGILGVLFSYEVMTAFFIEAGFLGVMLFGWNKVSHKFHYAATLLVLIGTTLSAYWIMCANTWMQHPVGYKFINNTYIATDWMAIIFNSYTWPRFLHMLFAAYLSTAFVIISISSYYLLRNKFINFSKKCLSFAVITAMIIIPLQIGIGDMTGVNVHKSQPIKTAAIEGIWTTQRGAPTILFALPSNNLQKNLFELGKIPHGSAIINTHQYNGELTGLKSVNPDDQPEVGIVFYSFRIMLGTGFLMLIYSVIATYMLVKNKLFQSTKMLYISQFLAPAGFIALLNGWITAEIGRQPWIVYGLIRTKDAVSHISVYNVLTTFVLIIIIYLIIFGVFYFYFLDKTIKQGPHDSNSIQPFGFLNDSAKHGDKL